MAKSIQNDSSIKFSDWLKSSPSDEKLREAFIGMDLAMKYIHGKGYFIKNFSLPTIDILNDSLNQIKFNNLEKMPYDMLDQKELIKEDIYNSAFVQIGIYTKCLKYLKSSFLRDNFDSFTTFLPEGDVPYYRGIVERGASVYLSDFAEEKRKRDLAKLENEVSGNEINSPQRDFSGSSSRGASSGKSLVKNNGRYLDVNEMSNNRSFSNIYSDLNRGDAAFIMPAMILILGFIVFVCIYLSAFVG